MASGVKDVLTEEEIEYGLKQVIKDGLTSQAMVTLTGGAFLVAFALKLGASNLVIGLMAAVPPWGSSFKSLPFFWFKRYEAGGLLRRSQPLSAEFSGYLSR